MAQMMRGVNDEFEFVKKTQQLDELMAYVILRARECKAKMQRLVLALTSGDNGPNFPALLGPRTLWKQLQDIENHKRSDHFLPTDLRKETLY